MNQKDVNYYTEDRQWDARFNVPTEAYLNQLLDSIRNSCNQGIVKYCLVGGVEIGTRPNQNDYQCKHVHVAIIFNNRHSKSSILKKWKIIEGHGYYLVPRNRELPYSGWKSHHTKPFSKVDDNQLLLFEFGQLPTDGDKKIIKASDTEKKRKLDDILMEMRQLYEQGKDEECFTKFPRNCILYGEKIKSLIHQKINFFKTNSNPHIWCYGYPGTGKTSLLQYIYPNYYKKNLYNKFFDLYKPDYHTHIILEDLDINAVERLSINFIKTICDKQGFSIDQKYKTPQLVTTSVLVTSNFTIDDIVPDEKGVEVNKAALLRRFWHVRVDELLRLLRLKLIPKWDQRKLQREGNNDMGKLFISWDYLTGTPLCTPIKSPTMLQEEIRDYYYSNF